MQLLYESPTLRFPSGTAGTPTGGQANALRALLLTTFFINLLLLNVHT
jgi:hypothetical protein